MTYAAYRGMLSNPRYIGEWTFGRKRNRWSARRDYTQQVTQPDDAVTTVRNEDLRIVSDELFFAVQERLEKWKVEPRGHRRRADLQLWDLVIECYTCAACSSGGERVRYYAAGSRAAGIGCKHHSTCTAWTILRRESAVRPVLQRLQELLLADRDLVRRVLCEARQISSSDLEEMDDRIPGVGWSHCEIHSPDRRSDRTRRDWLGGGSPRTEGNDPPRPGRAVEPAIRAGRPAGTPGGRRPRHP